MPQCAYHCKILVTLKLTTNSHAAELFSPGQTNINYPKIFFPVGELFVNIMQKPTVVNALHYNQTVSAMFFSQATWETFVKPAKLFSKTNTTCKCKVCEDCTQD